MAVRNPGWVIHTEMDPSSANSMCQSNGMRGIGCLGLVKDNIQADVSDIYNFTK